jgi:hypothetical protein
MSEVSPSKLGPLADELATSLKAGLAASGKYDDPTKALAQHYDQLVTQAKPGLTAAQTAGDEADKAPDASDARAAIAELQGDVRAQEIPGLDKAAQILTGIVALITGLFTGLGFVTGDFVRMFRDFFKLGLAFVLCAGLAMFLGTFAFLINSYRSNKNLRFEKIAIYAGVILAVAAFVLAACGISLGASNGTTKPTISASADSGSVPTVSIQMASADLPRTAAADLGVWGRTTADGEWTLLRWQVSGPTHDGSVAVSLGGVAVKGLKDLIAVGAISSDNGAKPPAPSGTEDCSGITSANSSAACLFLAF